MMTVAGDSMPETPSLRKLAEERSGPEDGETPQELLSPEEVRQMLHELRVHQIELEMQNEELRRAQAELKVSRSRYFDLYDLAPVGYFTLSETGQILEANLTAGTLLGVTRSDLVKQSLTRFIFPEDQDIYYQYRKQIPATGGARVCELRFVNKESGPFWARVEATSVPEADGRTVCRAVVSNITARKEAEVQTEILVRRLSALHRIDTAIAGAIDLRLALGVVLEQATAQLGTDAARVLLLDPVTLTLEYVAGRGFRTSSGMKSGIRLGESLAGRAALERRCIQATDPSQIKENRGVAALWSGEEFTACYCVPLISKGEVKGVLEVFHRTPCVIDADWQAFLETLAEQTAIAVDNAQLFKNLQHSNLELSLAYDETIKGWSRALDLRDKETGDHTRRVTEMTVRLAKKMGMTDTDLVHVRRGALLHDIGKMGVPDAILLKPGPLTENEWETMFQHPQFARDVLSPVSYLRQALDIPYSHHEKWDGSGYPQGMKGEQIPLAARLFAVVDVWDSLRSDRPYRAGWTADNVLKYLSSKAGSHFDPQAVALFLDMVDE